MNLFAKIFNKKEKTFPYQVGEKLALKSNGMEVYTVTDISVRENTNYYTIRNDKFYTDKKIVIEYELDRYYRKVH